MALRSRIAILGLSFYLAVLLSGSLPLAAAQLLVAPDGSSAYQTITEALLAASYGDTVHVEPGIYNEGIQFKNGVQLIGSGPGSTVIRYGYGFEPVIRAQHVSSGRIEGFAIERTEMTLAAPAVLLETASLTIVDCEIRSGQGAGIEARDPASHVTLERVSLLANLGHGLWVHGGARATLRDGLIRSNTQSGILLGDASRLDAEGTRVERNGAHGLALEGIADATLTRCEITQSSGWGADLRDSATLTLNGCTLTENVLGALRQRGSSSTHVMNTSILAGGAGCLLLEAAAIELSNSRVEAVTGVGLSVEGGADARVASTRIIGCMSDAVVFASSGNGSVQFADLVWNQGTALRAESGTVAIANSIIAYNDGDGLAASTGAVVITDHNNVWANGGDDYVGVLPRPTDISAPPNYVNLNAGDLRLLPDSACIGAGKGWSTIGSSGDPNEDATTRFDGSIVLLSLGEIALSARTRAVVSPIKLETLSFAASIQTERLFVRASTALLGSWGMRSEIGGQLTFFDSKANEDTEVTGRIEVDAVLAGVSTRIEPAIAVGLSGNGLDLNLRVSRTWPSTSWIGEAEVTLGETTQVGLFARVADLVPESMAARLSHHVSHGTMTQVADVGLSIGNAQEASLALRWNGPLRSFALHAKASLERLGDLSFSVDLAQPGDGIRAYASARVLAFGLDDLSLTAFKALGFASLSATIGIDPEAGGRLSLSASVDLTSLVRPAANEPPEAAFSMLPEDAQAEEPVFFDASASIDPDGQIVDYWWDFGDGSVDLGMTTSHTYAASGVYDVTLSLVDDDGATISLVQPITIWDRDTAPIASFFWEPVSQAGARLPRPLREGDRIRLDASSSVDPSENGLIYSWDLESDGLFDLSTEDPVHIIESLTSGTHPITLRVVDSHGRSHASMRAVLVSDLSAPVADFTFSPPSPAIFDPVRFVDGSIDADGSIAAWEWSFGDGATSRDAEPIHLYQGAGSYDVTLVVTDDDGLTAEVKHPITISQTPDTVSVSEVWVLAVGVSDYETVPDLEFARSDAIAVASWARDAGVPADHVRLLTDPQGLIDAPEGVDAKLATLVNVREGLGWLRRVAQWDDLVIIYFSGHGYQGIDDGTDERDGVDEFFVLLDTVGGAVDDTALRDDEFGRFLDRLASQHVLVLFDGCHSGGLSRSLPSGHRPTTETVDLFRDFSLQGRLILSAAGEAQDAFESPALGHGVFTHFVLTGLRGEADLNGDTQITAWELYEYVLEKVPAFVRDERGAEQLPQIHGEGDVRVIVSAIPRPPAPAISFQPPLPFAGGAIAFRDETASDSAARLWAFGDGRFSTREHPTHVYAQSGSHAVTLVVRDPSGMTASVVTEVVVQPPGRVTAVDDGIVILSLGRGNGLGIGDRFSLFSNGDDAPMGTIEIVELIGEREAAGRLTESTRDPQIGDLIRPHRETVPD